MRIRIIVQRDHPASVEVIYLSCSMDEYEGAYNTASAVRYGPGRGAAQCGCPLHSGDAASFAIDFPWSWIDPHHGRGRCGRVIADLANFVGTKRYQAFVLKSRLSQSTGSGTETASF